MAAFAAAIRAAGPNLDRIHLYALLTRFSQASSALAARDYATRRAEAGIQAHFTVPHAPVPTPEQFSKTLNWVYSDPQVVEQRLEAGMTRLAAQAGRETTVEAVHQDPQARAWARETRSGCCYFCAMLASRGAVYRSEGTAGKDANAKFTGSGAFKFHNNCHCVAVPVFGAYEKTAEARAWTRQWHDLRRELGHSPSLLQWRQHFEGRREVAPTATPNVPQHAGN